MGRAQVDVSGDQGEASRVLVATKVVLCARSAICLLTMAVQAGLDCVLSPWSFFYHFCHVVDRLRSGELR